MQLREAKRPNLLIGLVVSVLIALMGLYLFSALSNRETVIAPHSLGIEFEVAAALLLCWMLILTVVWSNYRGKFDPLEFPIWYGWNTYLQIIFNVWWFQRDFFYYSSTLRNSSSNWAVATVVLIGGSITVIWAVYAFIYIARMRKNEQRTELVGNDSNSLRINLMYVIWFITAAIQLFAIVSGTDNKLQGIQTELEVWSNYFAAVDAVNLLLSFMLLFTHFNRPTRLSRMWFFALIISQVLFPLLIGSKASVLAMLYVGMAYFYSQRKFTVSRRLVVFGVAGVFILSFTVPIAMQYRTALRNTNTSTGQFDTDFRFSLFQEVATAGLQNPFEFLFQSSAESVLKRQSGIFELTGAALLAHPDPRPYLGGELVSALPSLMLPRFLFPDKTVGRLDIYNTTGMYLDSQYVFFSAIGPFGDSYRLGGIPFVIIWMTFLGAMGAYVYTLGPSTRSIRFMAVYLLFVTYNGALAYSVHVYKTITILVYYVVPSMVVLYFVTRPEFRKERFLLKRRSWRQPPPSSFNQRFSPPGESEIVRGQ